ncbi:hypothetical protein F4781DRAFT_22834 [Annulohypoxylon bovei var. microspora]|nr:hypothetical protein F4781DRAFT_22834 [Annulohypoxylon bovei var. microspora]
MRTPKQLQNPDYKRHHLGQPPDSRVPLPNNRTVFVGDKVSLWAWPSRGGLIVLENVTALDFSFLHLDSVNPPTTRDQDQEEEDKFCQKLLLLGARWFDSRSRYGFVANVFGDEESEIGILEAGIEPALTLAERRWVSVGWPTGGEGCWVAEYETPVHGMIQTKNLVPFNAAQVLLARTMDEKCKILQGLGAKYYQNLDQYKGTACLNAWKQKKSGEAGPLVKY